MSASKDRHGEACLRRLCLRWHQPGDVPAPFAGCLRQSQAQLDCCSCPSLSLSTVLQELNSIEAIKSAVHHGLGVAFVSASAISKEVELGLACKIHVQGLRLRRTLQLISNPRREYPRMAQRFMVEVFNVKSNSEGRAARQQQSRLDALQHSEPAPRPWEQQKHRHR